jgi:predicted RNase H-like HicB family nuclease
MKKEILKYNVVLTKNAGGYTVIVPALPGCISQGKTVEQATEHVKEAIELYLEVLAEDGQKAPADTDIISSVVEVRSVGALSHA